jgi:glutathione synthase/RimK-type ligase-like ATP-grasp enzyme
VALAAAPQWPDLLDEGPLILAALGAAGLNGSTAVWSDPSVDWSGFDLVVANGAWDNIHHVDAYLGWVDMLERGGVPIVNSPATLRWNLDKRYLRDLEAAGVPIVPTAWVEHDGGGDGGDGGGGGGASARVTLEGEVVVKPSISGGGFRTARYEVHEHEQAREHVAELVRSGRTAMVQPYQETVDTEGEVGLIFLGGVFSHAIHKGPMIRRGAGALDSLIDNLVVAPVTPTAARLELARAAVAAAEELLGPTTYARVDTVMNGGGAPAVLELELLDPRMFFVTHPAQAARFAEVIAARLG